MYTPEGMGTLFLSQKFLVVLQKPKISLLACDAFLRACLKFFNVLTNKLLSINLKQTLETVQGVSLVCSILSSVILALGWVRWVSPRLVLPSSDPPSTPLLGFFPHPRG